MVTAMSTAWPRFGSSCAVPLISARRATKPLEVRLGQDDTFVRHATMVEGDESDEGGEVSHNLS